MTCKDCINCDKCPTGLACSANPTCGMFKPKSRFVELPCEVGQTVYRIGGDNCIYSWQICVIEIYPDEIALVDDSDNYIKPSEIGKTVFLTKEEAEKALKERIEK